MRFILLFLCILSFSCKYKVSDPLMPLKDYTAGKGITYYTSSTSTVSEIEDTLKKNKHSLGKYKLVVLSDESTNTQILTNIKCALDKNPSFDNVEIDITKIGITEIPTDIFKGAKNISSITLPNTVTNIGSNAFSGCSSLNNIRFSSELKTVSDGAFSNCSSLTLVILDSEELTNIGKNAFSGCSSLVNLILGANITNTNSIDCSSFSNCSKLMNVQYMGTNTNSVKCSPFSGSGANPSNLYLPNTNTNGSGRASSSSSGFLGKTNWTVFNGQSIPL